jgi:hypothetical protein
VVRSGAAAAIPAVEVVSEEPFRQYFRPRPAELLPAGAGVLSREKRDGGEGDAEPGLVFLSVNSAPEDLVRAVEDYIAALAGRRRKATKRDVYCAAFEWFAGRVNEGTVFLAPPVAGRRRLVAPVCPEVAERVHALTRGPGARTKLVSFAVTALRAFLGGEGRGERRAFEAGLRETDGRRKRGKRRKRR